MKIQSLVREQNALVPVEIEVSLLPGLPTIQFLGLPDQIIRESIHRIKSALRHQEFDFPRAQQILVNLRPNHLKKTSRGLELAVAAGILWETQQLKQPVLEKTFLYGELGLSGEVFEPEDLAKDFEAPEGSVVITGKLSSTRCSFGRRVVHEIRDLPQARWHEPRLQEVLLQRPVYGLDLEFPRAHARLLAVLGLGGHSVLLAGPAGSGKSTLAKAVASFVSAPSPEEILEIQKYNKDFREGCPLWRPVVHPHHSGTPLSLIGGGVPPQPGEIARAHRGILILDELLEFNTKVQESLREPMDEGSLRISRGVRVNRFSAQAQVLATTNLCPCGDFVPGQRPQCRYSVVKCRSYSQRLSGPLLDRFEVLVMTEKAGGEDVKKVSGLKVLEAVENSRAWRRQQGRGDPLNARLPLPVIEDQVESFYFKHLLNKDLGSHRRYQATLRVARSLADLEHQEKIQGPHIEEALRWTWLPFERLRRWD